MGQTPFYAGEAGLNLTLTNQLHSLMNSPTQFLECLKNYAWSFATNHAIIPFGTDFSFQHANINYAYLDDLIALVNNHTVLSKSVRFRYSTLDEYL